VILADKKNTSLIEDSFSPGFFFYQGPPGIPGMDGFDGQKGLGGDHGEDCKFCPDGIFFIF